MFISFEGLTQFTWTPLLGELKKWIATPMCAGEYRPYIPPMAFVPVRLGMPNVFVKICSISTKLQSRKTSVNPFLSEREVHVVLSFGAGFVVTSRPPYRSTSETIKLPQSPECKTV